MTLGEITDAQSLAGAFQTGIFGQITLLATLGLSGLLILLPVLGMAFRDERFVHAARRGQYLLLGFTMLAAATLLTMIFGGMFVTTYVRNVSELHEETFYKITGLWASQQGSLLFWCLILNIFGAVFAFANRHTRTDRRLPATLLVLAVVQTFFLSLLQLDHQSPFVLVIDSLKDPQFADMTLEQCFHKWGDQPWPGALWHVQSMATNLIQFATDVQQLEQFFSLPLADIHDRLVMDPSTLPAPALEDAITSFREGNGLNPQLHNPWIAIHPPVLYFGFIGFTIPFCYAVGSLISGELDATWIRRARLWTMSAWVFLTAGIAMGGLWAYEILGWGGYWAWDPVENASFIPWLAATAFIHSVIVQERRGMFKAWNVCLIILTYCLTVLGTFLVRSGIVESVHAFADTGLKMPLLIFFIIVFLVPLLLVVYRYPLLKATRGLDSLLSREAVFLGNNLLLTLLAAIVLVMTLWPAVTETLLGPERKFQWGAQAYSVITTPLFLLLIFFTAAGPLLSYGRTSKGMLARQFAFPLLALFVGAGVNAWLVIGSNHVHAIPAEGDAIVMLAAWTDRITQFVLPALVAMLGASVLQELVQAATLRKRSTKEAIPSAMMSVLLANRRRFGGYICHMGVALIATGIFLSSSYDTDDAHVLTPGEYAVLDGRWALVYDHSDETPLFRFAHSKEHSPTVLNAAQLLRENPTATTEQILEDLTSKHGGTLPPQMVAGMAKAAQAYEHQEIMSVAMQLWRDPNITLDDYLAHAKTGESPERRAQSERIYATAKAHATDPRAAEEFRAVVHFFPYVSGAEPDDRVAVVNHLRLGAAGDKESERAVRDLGWRALGGLRDVERDGNDAEKALAQSVLRDVLASAKGTLAPGIKIHRDKQTGGPRSGGVQADPEILELLDEDLYVTLQDIDLSAPGEPANFRVHVKPGMNLARLGLVVMVLGALFALLPRKRRTFPEPSLGM